MKNLIWQCKVAVVSQSWPVTEKYAYQEPIGKKCMTERDGISVNHMTRYVKTEQNYQFEIYAFKKGRPVSTIILCIVCPSLFLLSLKNSLMQALHYLKIFTKSENW